MSTISEVTRKVVVNSVNGTYWLTDAGDYQTNVPGVVVAEIAESEWREYQDHLETAQGWNDFIAGLLP